MRSRFWVILFDSIAEWLSDHKHEWTEWEPYGYTFQERKCLSCGKIQRINI